MRPIRLVVETTKSPADVADELARLVREHDALGPATFFGNVPRASGRVEGQAFHLRVDYTSAGLWGERSTWTAVCMGEIEETPSGARVVASISNPWARYISGFSALYAVLLGLGIAGIVVVLAAGADASPPDIAFAALVIGGLIVLFIGMNRWGSRREMSDAMLLTRLVERAAAPAEL